MSTVNNKACHFLEGHAVQQHVNNQNSWGNKEHTTLVVDLPPEPTITSHRSQRPTCRWSRFQLLLSLEGGEPGYRGGLQWFSPVLPGSCLKRTPSMIYRNRETTKLEWFYAHQDLLPKPPNCCVPTAACKYPDRSGQASFCNSLCNKSFKKLVASGVGQSG